MRKSHSLTSSMENAGFSTLTKPVNQPVGPKTMVRIKKSEKQEKLIKSFGQLSSEKVSFIN